MKRDPRIQKLAESLPADLRGWSAPPGTSSKDLLRALNLRAFEDRKNRIADLKEKQP